MLITKEKLAELAGRMSPKELALLVRVLDLKIEEKVFENGAYNEIST